jgi:hypothetical protein
MIVAGRRIQEFIAGQDFDAFSADLNTQSAVILQILILGELDEREREAQGAGGDPWRTTALEVVARRGSRVSTSLMAAPWRPAGRFPRRPS